MCFKIPPNWEGQIRPRSGFALKHGITFLNAPGTIDSYYRGKVAVILINLGKEDYTVNTSDKIAQIILNRITKHELYRIDENLSFFVEKRNVMEKNLDQLTLFQRLNLIMNNSRNFQNFVMNN